MPPRTAPTSLSADPAQEGSTRAWGVYVLLAAATLLEVYYGATPYPDDLGMYVRFFQDISTVWHIKGLSFSLGEVFMAVLLLGLLFKAAGDRSFHFDRGSLMRPLGLYMIMVGVADLNGIFTGGNSTVALWEVRPQAYMFVAYILTCNLVKTRKQVATLIGIIVVGNGLKGIQGVWRYAITLGGNIHGVESIFPHEQSFFYNELLTLTPILFLYGGSRRLKRFALLMLPMVLVSSLANQRRAAWLALAVGYTVMLLITGVTQRARRRLVVGLMLVMAVVFPFYVTAFKNSAGLTGEVARSFSSVTSPNQRDLNSNIYRTNEDKDIMATVKLNTTSTLIGYGFGKPMAVPYPLPDIAEISAAYAFWNIMPHDSILWIWMRLGTIGYMIFWIMIASAIMQATALVRRLRDPFLRGVAVWIVCMIMQEIIFGYLDLQWVNYRNLITMGVLLALISRLAALAGHRAPRARQAPPPQRPPGPRRPDLSHSLAVVDGRLVGG